MANYMISYNVAINTSGGNAETPGGIPGLVILTTLVRYLSPWLSVLKLQSLFQQDLWDQTTLIPRKGKEVGRKLKFYQVSAIYNQLHMISTKYIT